MSRLLKLANENIDFQINDDFGDKLAELIAMLKEDHYGENIDYNYSAVSAIGEHHAVKKIEDLVYDRLGLPIKLIFDVIENAYVYPPMLPFRYSLDDSWGYLTGYEGGEVNIDKIAKEINDSLKDNKLRIDTKHAKIYGLDKKYRITVCIGAPLVVSDKYTSKEVAAILMHELGHAFTYIEYMTNTHRESLTMADEILKLTKKNDKAYTRDAIVKTISKYTSPDIHKELKNISKEDNDFIFSLQVFKAIIKDKNNEFMEKLPRISPSRNAIMPESEVVADEFVTRFGYGEHLVTALGTLTKHKFYNISKDDTLYGVSNLVLSDVIVDILISLWTTLILSLFLSASMLVLPFLTPILIIALYTIFVRASQYVIGNRDYGSTDERPKRIRNTLVRAIKENKLDRKTAKYYISVIDRIDKVVEKERVLGTHPIARTILTILAPDSNRELSNVALHRLIEELNTNDLFVMREKLLKNI